MRSRLFFAPWWVHVIETAAFYAVFMGAYAVFEDDLGWLTAGIIAAVGGLFVGGVTAGRTVRERVRWRVAVGRDLDDAEAILVHRAASRGPVPHDPRLRAAALRAATFELGRRKDGRWSELAVLALLPASVALHVWDSRWWLVLAPFFVYAAYDMWAGPRRVRSRLAELTAASSVA